MPETIKLTDEDKDMMEKGTKILLDYFESIKKDMEEELGKSVSVKAIIEEVRYPKFTSSEWKEIPVLVPSLVINEDASFRIAFDFYEDRRYYPTTSTQGLDLDVNKPFLNYCPEGSTNSPFRARGAWKKYKTFKSYLTAKKTLTKAQKKPIVPMAKNVGRYSNSNVNTNTSIALAIGDVVMFSTTYYVVKSWKRDPRFPTSPKKCIVNVLQAEEGGRTTEQEFKAEQLWGGHAIATSIKSLLEDHPEDAPLYINGKDPIAKVIAQKILSSD